jgi:hypothetical protein
MRTRIVVTVAAAALVTGSFGTVATAQAAQSSQDTTTYSTYSPTPAPTVQALDCHGTTGSYGCGPGWYWNGNKCVPC